MGTHGSLGVISALTSQLVCSSCCKYHIMQACVRRLCVMFCGHCCPPLALLLPMAYRHVSAVCVTPLSAWHGRFWLQHRMWPGLYVHHCTFAIHDALLAWWWGRSPAPEQASMHVCLMYNEGGCGGGDGTGAVSHARVIGPHCFWFHSCPDCSSPD